MTLTFNGSARGFTLVEILVVMVLFALAGSMVFTSVGKSRSDRENKDFARGFTALCQKARRKAVAGGLPVAVRISEPLRQCWIGNGKKRLAIPEEMLIEAEGGGRMGEAEAFSFSFYPDGSSDGVTFTFTAADSFRRRIRIDMLTGLVGKVADE